MKVFAGRIGIPTVAALTAVTLLSLVTAPGVYTISKKAHGGKTALELYDGLQAVTGSQTMSEVPPMQREMIRQAAVRSGTRYGILVLFGQHLPVSLLVLLTVCSISHSTTPEFRRLLHKYFLLVSLVGIFLSALVIQRGQNYSVGESVRVSATLYALLAVFLWAAIGAGYFSRRYSPPKPDYIASTAQAVAVEH